MYSKDAGKDQMLMTMERALTSGQKAGFFFLGFLGGIVGILAASLMNINAPYRPEGTKMAALGFAGWRDSATKYCDRCMVRKMTDFYNALDEHEFSEGMPEYQAIVNY